MPAILAKLGQLLPLLLGSGGAASAAVRVGRLLYSASVGFIAVAWYSSWRNRKVGGKDFTKWPIPGIERGGDVGAPSRPDPDVSGYDAVIGGSSNPITANDNIGVLPGALGTSNLGPTPANTGSQQTTLYHLATVAKQQFGLSVTEYPPFGPVHQVHTSTSLHYKGKAFDCSGPEVRMHAFAQYVQSNYGRTVTELIHNPGFSIKDGQVRPPSFWGADVWAGHKDHVHVAIAR